MMIDHLDIESKIIVAECNEAKLQVRKFGIPPPIGKILTFLCQSCCPSITLPSYARRLKASNNSMKAFFLLHYTTTLTGENDEDEIAYRDEIFKEVTLLEKKDKITNQFHFIERATQTKNNDTIETESQTDPPPMYSQGGF